MRGAITKPELKEKVMQVYAVEGSYAEVGRQLGIAKQTAYDLIQHNLDIGQFRTEIEQAYIVQAWNTVTAAHRALHDQLSNPEYVGRLSAVELSGIIAQLHRTVTNVAEHVTAIQVNMVADSAEDLESAAYEYVAMQHNMTVKTVKERLTKVD